MGQSDLDWHGSARHRRGILNVPRIYPIHWREFERVLFALGFSFVRQEGSHRVYEKAGLSRPIVVPAHGQVPVAIILNNLKTAGISREKFLELL